MEQKAKRITLKDRVLKYMQDFGSISSLEAFKDLGCTRLSALIFLLRKDYRIDDEWVKTTNRYGDKVEFKRYFIVEG